MANEHEKMSADESGLYFGELDLDSTESSLEAKLQHQLSDLAFLEEEKEKIENPDHLGKVILDEVWNQFGNQIGLDLTSETLIQAYDKTHPKSYNKEIGNAILSDDKYKQANNAMKQRQADGTLIDTYTGKKLSATDKSNLDHVVSRKELYENARRKQANIDTKDLANKAENLAPTNETLNKSKKDKSNQEYVANRERMEENYKKRIDRTKKKIDASNKSEAEKRIERQKVDKNLQNRLDADDQLMLDADKKARQAINRDIACGVAKQTAKKAGIDALKMVAVSALFDLLKSVINGLIRFFREKQKTFQRFLEEMKGAINKFVSHISNLVSTGASSFIGTVVSEIFGPIVSMFKKLTSFIKQGASTLLEAIRYLADKENKNKPLSIKIAQVGKIVTAGLVAAGAIIGGEFFEKILLQIPVMAVEIPFLGSIANITGMFLASLLAGIVGAIIMNCLDRWIAKQQKNKNIASQITQKTEILKTQDDLIRIKGEKLTQTKVAAAQNIVSNHKQASEIVHSALTEIFSEDDDLSVENDALDRMLQTYL